MKITILSGSPKLSNESVTMQYMFYIMNAFPQHEYTVYDAAHYIKRAETDQAYFDLIMKSIAESDMIFWAFPLYYCLVASQYKRFIELIFERKAEKFFKNKYAAALSTSIHFFDNTAHDYIHAISEDLGMFYAGNFSPDMHDFFKENSRRNMLVFAEDVLLCAEEERSVPRRFLPVKNKPLAYKPAAPKNRVPLDKKMLIITDAEHSQKNISFMISRFQKAFSREIECINLHDLDIKGGCLGCLRCALDNDCVYGTSDGYIAFFTEQVLPADIIIFAGTIKDRYLSSQFKEFFDRSFFLTHQPVMKDKQLGFLISGPLSQNHTLRQILESYTEVEFANLIGCISDEWDSSSQLDARIQSFAEKTAMYAQKNYQKPAMFSGIAGRILFRDAIWGHLRFPFLADHRYYKKTGMYNFPQKNITSRIKNFLLGALMLIPPVQKEVRNRMKSEMVKPYCAVNKK